MRGLLGSTYRRASAPRLVSANFENASRIRAFGLRSGFRTRQSYSPGPVANTDTKLLI